MTRARERERADDLRAELPVLRAVRALRGEAPEDPRGRRRGVAHGPDPGHGQRDAGESERGA